MDDAQRSLDDIGILEGTDKTSLAVDYLRHYDRIFRDIRDEPIQLLEIGIARGASLRMWQRYLPNATIVGVDLGASCLAYATDRVTVEIGSQADPEFLDGLAAKYSPNVIVDDGSHNPTHNFLTFNHLFPSLRPSGIYLIEDVFLHHGPNAALWHPDGGITPTEYFTTMARSLTSQMPDAAVDGQIAKQIECIEFIPGAIIIHKRRDDNVPKAQLDHLLQLADQADKPLTWFCLSYFLMTHDLERAEFAAQRAISLVPGNADYLMRLAGIQDARGNLSGAIETLGEGVRHNPRNTILFNTLASFEDRLAKKR
jgi:tetratricopeptide (TPR) repeat protein